MLTILLKLASLVTLALLRTLAALLLLTFKTLGLPGSAAAAALCCIAKVVRTALEHLLRLLRDALFLLVSNALSLLFNSVSKALAASATFARDGGRELADMVKDATTSALRRALEHAAGLLWEALELLLELVKDGLLSMRGDLRQAAGGGAGILSGVAEQVYEIVKDVVSSLAWDAVEMLSSARAGAANRTAAAVGQLVENAVAVVENWSDVLEKVDKAVRTVLEFWDNGAGE